MTIEFLSQMQKRFNKEEAADLKAVYKFQVDDNQQYFLKIENGSCDLIEEFHEPANVTLKADQATWKSIIEGSMPAQMAFMMGKLSVTGDFQLALKLPKIFEL
jgi:putative sterol carrier protein